ncbi:hypothetical protein [Nocardia australiensis]|uniref:hypothetical protein n=1 Tax=Nocardia australiensis TaxID=2887191 RepID=UPI001D154A49|nr:hypothetical protein [Nocardia australiensis]
MTTSSELPGIYPADRHHTPTIPDRDHGGIRHTAIAHPRPPRGYAGFGHHTSPATRPEGRSGIGIHTRGYFGTFQRPSNSRDRCRALHTCCG